MKSEMLRRLEKAVEMQTGMPVDEIRRTPLCELREKRRWKFTKMTTMALFNALP